MNVPYHIRDFRKAAGRKHSHFVITLDIHLARLFADKGRTAGAPHLASYEDIQRAFFPRHSFFERPSFLGDSMLLTGVRAPGNCCCFTVDHGQLKRMQADGGRSLKYTCHNVDSTTQATCILQQWLNWFDLMCYTTDGVDLIY